VLDISRPSLAHDPRMKRPSPSSPGSWPWTRPAPP